MATSRLAVLQILHFYFVRCKSQKCRSQFLKVESKLATVFTESFLRNIYSLNLNKAVSAKFGEERFNQYATRKSSHVTFIRPSLYNSHWHMLPSNLFLFSIFNKSDESIFFERNELIQVFCTFLFIFCVFYYWFEMKHWLILTWILTNLVQIWPRGKNRASWATTDN